MHSLYALRRFTPCALAAAVATLLVACGGGGAPADGGKAMSAQAALGEKIFNDRSLSAAGRQACASCHVEAAGHAQDNAQAAQSGGADLNLQGSRVAPSIRYLATNSAFHFAADGTPTGGFFWDGRAASLADQAGRPFLNPVEMALATPADVVAKLAQATYAEEFRQVFGAEIFSRPDDAFERVKLALQAYQREDGEFRAFTSK